jgi:hypothetical protein
VECQTVKKEWRYNSTLPYISIRDNMTFIWLTVTRVVLIYLGGYKLLVAVVTWLQALGCGCDMVTSSWLRLWHPVFCSDFLAFSWFCSFLTNARIVSQIKSSEYVHYFKLFGERGIVLCLFNLKSFVQLDTRFTYLIWTVFSVVYSVFCIVLWHCTTLCYSFSSAYCTVHCSCIVLCLLVMYVLLP